MKTFLNIAGFYFLLMAIGFFFDLLEPTSFTAASLAFCAMSFAFAAASSR